VLISDLERSTELWEHYDRAMEPVIVAHNAVITAAVEEHGGWVLGLRGDGVTALFSDPTQAVYAAVAIQREFSTRRFVDIGELRVRVGINAGSCAIRRGELYGRPPNLAARLEAAAHGGQILLSDTVAAACESGLRDGVDLFELGRYSFRGFDEPIVVHSVIALGLRHAFPPLRTPTRGLDELPMEDAPLVGREELTAQVETLVCSHPLVTLWGPGGVGKTRVAVRAAGRIRRPFRHGVRFVDLSVIDDADHVAAQVLAILRAQPRVGETSIDTVRRVLGGARVLLVLDNCEHVLPGVRALVEDLAADGGGAHILATSRQALEVPLERLVEVAPLTGADAVELFVERAVAVSAHFRLTTANAGPIAMLCQALDGLPLGIELAAARMDVDTVENLVRSRLESSGPVDAGVRLRSMAGSIGWSYERLPPPVAMLFRRLGVFAGSFSRPMAMALGSDLDTSECGDAFDALVRAAMIMREPPPVERFRLLETAREYVQVVSSPEEWRATRADHAALMLSRAETWGPRLRTDEAVTAVGVLESDLADHRRAMAWFLEERATENASRLVVNLTTFGLFHLHAEIAEWAGTIAEHMDDEVPLASELLGSAALGAWFTGDTERAVALGLRSVAAAANHGGSTIWARTALVDALGYAGRLDELVGHYQALTDEQRSSPEPFWQVDGLVFRAISLSMFGQVERAQAAAEKALVLARRLDNPYCTHWALYGLGRALATTDPRAACDAMERSMQAAREIDSRFNLGLGLVQWLALRRQLGETDDCVTAALDLLDILTVSGNRSQLSETLREVGLLLGRLGRTEDAAVALLARSGLPRMPGDTGEQDDAKETAGLEDQLVNTWAQLRIEALATSERTLISRCREALLLAATN
jgi:predicted ATPase/class 3 adenylate cyclase